MPVEQHTKGRPIVRLAFVVPPVVGGHDGIPAKDMRTGEANSLIEGKRLMATADFEKRICWLRYDPGLGAVSINAVPFENVSWMLFGAEK